MTLLGLGVMIMMFMIFIAIIYNEDSWDALNATLKQKYWTAVPLTYVSVEDDNALLVNASLPLRN